MCPTHNCHDQLCCFCTLSFWPRHSSRHFPLLYGIKNKLFSFSKKFPSSLANYPTFSPLKCQFLLSFESVYASYFNFLPKFSYMSPLNLEKSLINIHKVIWWHSLVVFFKRLILLGCLEKAGGETPVVLNFMPIVQVKDFHCLPLFLQLHFCFWLIENAA